VGRLAVRIIRPDVDAKTSLRGRPREGWFKRRGGCCGSSQGDSTVRIADGAETVAWIARPCDGLGESL